MKGNSLQFLQIRLQTSGFFSWGTGGIPYAAKILPVPPPNSRPCFLTRACPLQPSLVPRNSKVLLIFFLNFDYFIAKNCIRKLYFMLKTPKFALILL